MKIDEDEWHELKDKLYILKKRVDEHVEDREDMIKLLQCFVNPEKHRVGLRRAMIATRKFLHDIGELD